jgi:hypothetical protein
MNKIHHKFYNPTIVNKEWRGHFQEIINHDMNNDDNSTDRTKFDISKEFGEKLEMVKHSKKH